MRSNTGFTAFQFYDKKIVPTAPIVYPDLGDCGWGDGTGRTDPCLCCVVLSCACLFHGGSLTSTEHSYSPTKIDRENEKEAKHCFTPDYECATAKGKNCVPMMKNIWIFLFMSCIIIRYFMYRQQLCN